MRISNISEYAGGADNVVASEYVNGSKHIDTLVLRDSSGSVFDLTDYTYELDVQFGLSDIQAAGRSINITRLILDLDDSGMPTLAAKDISSAVSTLVAADGTFTIEWPVDLYEGTVPLDATTNVPVCICTLYINDNESSNTIRTVRFLRFVRFGASST